MKINYNYEQAKFNKKILDIKLRNADLELKKIDGIGSGPMGLTPDHIRSSEAYKIAKSNYDKAFNAFRNHNKEMNKKFKKEVKADDQAMTLDRTLWTEYIKDLKELAYCLSIDI